MQSGLNLAQPSCQVEIGSHALAAGSTTGEADQWRAAKGCKAGEYTSLCLGGNGGPKKILHLGFRASFGSNFKPSDNSYVERLSMALFPIEKDLKGTV